MRRQDPETVSESMHIYKNAVEARPPLKSRNIGLNMTKNDISRFKQKNPERAHSDIRSRNLKTKTYTLTTAEIEESEEEEEAEEEEEEESDAPISDCDQMLDDLSMNRSPQLDRRFHRAKKQLKVLDKLQFMEQAQKLESEPTFSERESDLPIITESKRINVSFFKTFLFMFGTLMIVVAVLLISKSNKTVVLYNIADLEERMNEKFNQLQLDFPGQRSKFRLLRVAVKAIFLREPKQPTIVTLLASSGAETTTSCFARTLANTIESIFEENKNFIHRSGHDLRNKLLDASLIKKELDDAANGGFHNGSRVFLLENFNLIPIDSAMIFHGLCDDNFAPFKKVFYLFTMNLVDLGISSISKDNELKRFEVTSGWSKDLDENQLSSLESRIGTYKLVIEREENISNLKEKWNC